MSVHRRTHRSSILNRVSKIISPILFWRKRIPDVSNLILTPFEAIKELERRRQDLTLQKKVEEYLKGDIPEYFKDGPISHITRYIVTPNYETLRFISLMEHLGLKVVASQDSRGLFVSQNQVKKALCKLPVCRRVTQKGDKLNEQYQNVTIVDFNTTDGKLFSDIDTLWGESLIGFHTRLFLEFNLGNITVPDDADWIDRHGRGDLLAHYKQLLALYVVHGIFFENYNLADENEVHFVETIVRPASLFIEKMFGYRPIIVPIFPNTFESDRFWISYPSKILDIVRKSMHAVVI